MSENIFILCCIKIYDLRQLNFYMTREPRFIPISKKREGER